MQTALFKTRRHGLLALLCLTLGSSFSALTMAKEPHHILVPVIYATDRAVDKPSDPDKYFGHDRAVLSYGTVDVAVDLKDKVDSPVIDLNRWPLIRDQEIKKGHRLLAVNPMTDTGYRDALGRAIANADINDVLVYLHGYSKTFKTVARNAALMSYEMNYRGTSVLYSWPSRGTATGYATDLVTADWSATKFTQLLRELSQREDVGNIHIMAHSMGHRIMFSSLAELSTDQEFLAQDKLGEIIMMAPDYDTDTFSERVLPHLLKLNTRLSLYVSDHDVPLQASRRISRYPRLGDSRDQLYIAPPVETIDLSDVVSVFNGHSAHRDSGATQADINKLLHERLGAAERSTLATITDRRGTYWRVKPLD